MISNILGYLFIGVVWDIILEITGNILKSEHKLNSYEKVFSIVLWPITLCIFTYHFVKTFFQR